MPITRETFNTKVKSCVIAPLFVAENQFADILA